MERQRREVADRYGRISLLPVHAFLDDLWAGRIASAR